MQNLFNGEDETRSGLDELTPCHCVCVCMWGEAERERRVAQPSRTLHHRVNCDSAVSGNIHLHAERLIGMPHNILHAFNTFQFNVA